MSAANTVELKQCSTNTVPASVAAVDLQQFCIATVPDFTPLGGSRPDAAVVACTAVSLFTDGLIPRDVILPPDVLDTGLAFLCAPLRVTHTEDLLGQEAAFRCPAMSVSLHTIDTDVLQGLRSLADNASCKLTVMMKLSDSVAALPDELMSGWESVTCIDLKRTAVQSIGDSFADGWPGVTDYTLGHNCPKQCSNVTQVDLPATLTVIGNRFLAACKRLQVIDLKHTLLQSVGNDFASHCPNLMEVALPHTVTVIGDYFIQNCDRLHVIDLKNTALQRIGERFAFHCLNVTTVALPDSVTEIGDGFLQYCHSVPVIDLQNTALKIVTTLFAAYCSSLTTVILPDTVTEVDDGFLCDCDSMKLIDLKNTALQTLYDHFAGCCPNLTTVALPDTVTKVGHNFVRQSESIQVIDLTNTGIQSVGAGFASECPNLTTVALPDTVTEVGSGFLDNCKRIALIDLKNTALQRVRDCDGYFNFCGFDRVVKGFAHDCPNLTSVLLPDTLTEIGDHFVGKCERIQLIDLNNTALQRVGKHFASDCPNLTTVTLPDTVTEVGTAFLHGSDRVVQVNGSTAVHSARVRHKVRSTVVFRTALEAVHFNYEIFAFPRSTYNARWPIKGRWRR